MPGLLKIKKTFIFFWRFTVLFLQGFEGMVSSFLVVNYIPAVIGYDTRADTEITCLTVHGCSLGLLHSLIK